jgi:L-threonylcarbamoyladenylate synthase
MSESTDPIERAAAILSRGGLVAFATETVYGLGADATNGAAVERIFLAKGRPRGNPLIVHVPDAPAARRYAADWPAAAEKLAARFWPGPLTIVVTAAPSIAPAVMAGLATVGLRAPDHPVAQALLRRFDGPIAAPSANRSSRISPTTAEHVRRELGTRVDLILDGGPCRIGIESTVISVAGEQPTILRPGHVDRLSIESIIGPVRDGASVVETSQVSASPGQHAIHYAPLSPCVRFEADERSMVTARLAAGRETGAAMMVMSSDLVAAARGAGVGAHVMATNAGEYAKDMYAVLRTADESRPVRIWIEMPPDEPAWQAVRDRLRRASGPIRSLADG